MKREISKGFYLVIEGPDGGGKTTQYNLLADKLSEEFDVLRVKEPGATKFGAKIRAMLLDPSYDSLAPLTEVFLFSADRRHTLENVVMPALAEGKLVISDRNYYSTEAYQSAGGGVDIGEVRKISALATAGVDHNLAVILDIDSETGLRRARGVSEIKDKIEARGLEYHKKVRDAYLEIAKRDSGVCVVIDASKSINAIHEELYRVSKERIYKVLKSP